ncbi:hypothetical protein BSKO_08097 [Bryopsis sp. KO-2023]|nr:hypothetical protein BSKO_08097 [Bryopsis sp. KO-2023]
MGKRRRANVAAAAAAAAAPDSNQPKKAKAVKKKEPTAEKEEKVEDDRKRCGWAGEYAGAGSQLYIEYHDNEWGRPCYDDVKLFEMLTLEGAQAGLSWATILKKRESYREAFRGFDPATVAEFTDEDVKRLLQPESGIVKHKGKILSTISNAKCALEAQEEFGSLSKMLWDYVPDGKPIVNEWKKMSEVPAKTAEAEAMCKGLKERGFKFVGPTICYAFMQAVGMVNDHVTDCFCYSLMETNDNDKAESAEDKEKDKEK